MNWKVGQKKETIIKHVITDPCQSSPKNDFKHIPTVQKVESDSKSGSKEHSKRFERNSVSRQSEGASTTLSSSFNTGKTISVMFITSYYYVWRFHVSIDII